MLSGTNFLRTAAVALLIALNALNAQAQAPVRKQIAVTIDDLPLNGTDIGLKRLRKMTRSLLDAFVEYKVPVVGFVNEGQLYVPGEIDERIGVLRMWADAGMELGNHTFGHTRFGDVSLEEFQNDVIRGEVVSGMIAKERSKKLRFFRHPYLKMGATREIELSFETFLAARGYRMAPMTSDSMDWMFVFAYREVKSEGERRRLVDSYLDLAIGRIDYSEKASREIFGRQVPQILLVHANELNGEALGSLLKRLRDGGYEFITLEKAMEDEAYRYPDRYTDTSDWLTVWANSKGIRLNPPQPPEEVRQIFNRANAGH